MMPGVLVYQCTNGKTTATVRTTRSGFIVRVRGNPLVNLTFVKTNPRAQLEAVNLAENRVFGYKVKYFN